jgi:hypothetical protein
VKDKEREASPGEGNELNKLSTLALTMAGSVVLMSAAGAQLLARSDYQAREEAISARYRSADRRCALLAAHAKAVCRAEAGAEDRIARAELEAQYRPSAKSRHQALVVAADSRHVVARLRCDQRTGVARTDCIVQAASDRTLARADAIARLRVAEANAKATEQADEDREEAASDTFAARYAAARLQCDGYIDKLRELCLQQTRDHYLNP